MSFFLKTTVLFKCCKGGQSVGTWLHGNLYIVHYEGFEWAEIWHSCAQPEAANLHLLLFPEMLEIPSLCVSRKICPETHVWPVVFDSQDGSTRKIIMAAWESLDTVILRVITDYRIFLVFSMVQTVATEKGSQASYCGIHIMSTHIVIHSSLTTKEQVHFSLHSCLYPLCSFFTSCGEG